MASLALVGMVLTGCSEDQALVGNDGVAANGVEAAPDGPSASMRKAASSGGDPGGLEAQLTCWALTNRAYFMHRAVKRGGGNLPEPKPAIYLGWAGLAATTAHGAGMKLSEFESRQQQAQRAATVYSLDVEPEHAAAVQRCIDTAPPGSGNPDLTWPEE